MDSYCTVEHRYNESFYIEQLLNAATNEFFLLQLSHDPNTTFRIMLIIKIKNICTKNKLALRKKSLPNREKLIGNCYYPGNPDVYAGSLIMQFSNTNTKSPLRSKFQHLLNSFGCSRYGYIRLDHFLLAFISPVT